MFPPTLTTIYNQPLFRRHQPRLFKPTRNLAAVAVIHGHQELALSATDNRSISSEKLLYVTLFDLI